MKEPYHCPDMTEKLVCGTLSKEKKSSQALDVRHLIFSLFVFYLDVYSMYSWCVHKLKCHLYCASDVNINKDVLYHMTAYLLPCFASKRLPHMTASVCSQY